MLNNSIFKHILENIDTPLLVSDENFIIEFTNKNFRNYLKNAKELEQKFLLDYISDNELKNWFNNILFSIDSQGIYNGYIKFDFFEEKLNVFIKKLPLDNNLYYIFQFHKELQNNELLKDIEHYKKSLEQMDKYLKNDLMLAELIQKSILPDKNIKLVGLDIFFDYIASEIIGGDFFDVVNMSNNRHGFLIADVSGHGIAASMISSMLKMSFMTFSSEVEFPDEVLAMINAQLSEVLLPEYFISIFYGIYNSKTRMFYYADAGHPEMLLYKKKDNKIIKLKAGGNLINIEKKSSYEYKSIKLDIGDKLLLFTDGLLEAKSQKSLEEFGTERLEKLFLESVTLENKNAVEKILSEVKKYSNNKIYDDITIAIIEFKENILTINTLNEINDIIKFLDNYLEVLNAEFDNKTAILLCVHEALVNAFEHGNDSDPTKKIKIYYEYKSESHSFFITISDEGPGFDLNKIPDPTDETNLLKEGGRGIFIIKSYMDKVIFNEKGNEITMIKEL